MLIAISTNGSDLDSPLEPRFGRATGFIIYDVDSQDHRFVDNSVNSKLAQGSGLQTAQLLAGQGVNVVITGRVGPNASQALNSGGIRTLAMSGGRVRDALEHFKNDGLDETSCESISMDDPSSGSKQLPPQGDRGCRRMGGRGMGRGGGGGMGRGGGGGQGR
ncbi:MAG: hypothetical protein BA863_19350 [Desulfovibrio sp. S3730MH75]|nr:MAG: hypothetical protein BA863_19350 [Desulfovibrio sp. S3730MH75]